MTVGGGTVLRPNLELPKSAPRWSMYSEAVCVQQWCRIVLCFLFQGTVMESRQQELVIAYAKQVHFCMRNVRVNRDRR